MNEKTDNHPAVEHLLQFFGYAHLPPHLAEASKPFCELAHKIAADTPSSPEKTVALRKLMEAKDCAVRCFVGQPEHKRPPVGLKPRFVALEQRRDEIEAARKRFMLASKKVPIAWLQELAVIVEELETTPGSDCERIETIKAADA